MNVHECQAKGLLREYGVAVPPGGVATTPAKAEEVARGLTKGVLVAEAPGATWLTASFSGTLRLSKPTSRSYDASLAQDAEFNALISKDFPEDPP